MTENATFSKRERRMLGFDLDSWNNILVGFLMVAALAGAIVGVSTYVVIRLQRATELETQRELVAARLDATHAVLQTSILSKETAEATERAAVAEQHAAEANLELARMKLPRSLTPEYQQQLSAKMKSYAGTPFTMGAFNDPEPLDLMLQIDNALTAAGWNEVEWKSGGDIVLGRAPRPNFGYTLVVGLYIQADNKHASDFGPIVHALASALTEAGIPAKPEVGRMDTNNDAIKILVGKKPL